MALDVKVKIDLNKPIGNMSYSCPLILVVEGADVTDKGYVECKTLDNVISVGYTNTSNAYKTASLMLSQNNAPSKFAIVNCATGKETETIGKCLKYDWRQLVVVLEGETSKPAATLVKTISDYVETTDRMYFCSVSATSDISKLTKANDRTVVFYYTDTAKVCPEAAIVGASAGLNAGSFTYKNLIINNVEPLELSDTEIESTHTAGAITIVSKAGDNVLTEGKVLSGEYIDIIDSKDFVIKNISYKTQKVFNTADKVPYDNNGIAMLESATIDVMREAYNNGIIATNEDGTPAYTVSFALRSATTEADRKARIYPYGSFSFVLAGAIHYAEITGEITM
jgi:hypothetical protein